MSASICVYASVCVPMYICKCMFVCVCVHVFGFLCRGELVFLLIFVTAGAGEREDDGTLRILNAFIRDALLRES